MMSNRNIMEIGKKQENKNKKKVNIDRQGDKKTREIVVDD